MTTALDPKVIEVLVPGPQGAPGAVIRGAYDPAVQYEARDAVTLNGSSWYTLTPVIGIAPPASPWVALAAKGDQGPQGPQGTQGPKGDKGDQGVQGPQGVAGPQGPKGDKGDKGDQGVQGSEGAQGVAGPKGDKGDQGDQGDAGPKGDAGDQGPAGAQGIKGDKGDQGDAGPKGDTGAQGLKGDKGDQGDAGPQGAAGPQGPQGAGGPQGPQGPQGNDGPAGAQGTQGVAGPQGPQGAEGPQGIKGDKGDTGAVGAVGPQGAQGVKGDAGATLVAKGAYDNAAIYSSNQVVTYSGSAYYLPDTFVGTQTGVVPPTAPWLLWNDNTTAANAALSAANLAVLQAAASAAAAQVSAANASSVDVTTFLKRVTSDYLFGKMARFRVGNRLYATLDAATGWYFRKGRLAAGMTVDDQAATPISSRLLAGPFGSWFKKPGVELIDPSSTFIRFRVGNRLLGTWEKVRGFYPRRATLPATATIDDDLTSALPTRLLPSGLGVYFKRLTKEAGGTLRFRWGNRLLGQWTPSGGMQWTRETLPSDCKIADQPTVNLIDRLGGSGGSSSANANWVAISYADTSGKFQIATHKRSDGSRVQLTNGATSYRSPFVTPDDKVLFYSDADGRMMYAPAGGGAIYPVNPLPAVACYGDSLTNGTGSSGSGAGQGSYPKQLADRLGNVVTAVYNRGVGGQTSVEIEARDGGAPVLLTVTSNQIPVSGAVAVTAWTAGTFPITNQGPGNMTGTMAGVPGTLAATAFDGNGRATAASFTRTSAGSVVACPAGTPFIPDLGVADRLLCKLFKYGRNNNNNLAQILASIAAGVGYQAAYVPRFLVGSVLMGISGVLNGDTEATRVSIAADNAAILAAYPSNYVDTNAPPTTAEMALLGYTQDYAIYLDASGVPTSRTDAADLVGKASALITFSGQPASNDTITINGQAITFVASGAVGAQVNIGGSTAATAGNLVTYIAANSVALGVIGQVVTPSSTTYVILTAVTAGTAGNALNLAKSSVNLVLSGATLTGGSAYGVIPSGMRKGAVDGLGDYLHGNNFLYDLWSLRDYRAIYAKGWFPTLPLV